MLAVERRRLCLRVNFHFPHLSPFSPELVGIPSRHWFWRETKRRQNAFTSNVQSSSTAESGDSHRRRMKNGASTHAPLHQAVNSFFGGVKQFAAHAESEARDLRTSVEKPPLSGTQGTRLKSIHLKLHVRTVMSSVHAGYSSLFMKRMMTDVCRLQKDVATMHSQFTSAVSFKEIIEVHIFR